MSLKLYNTLTRKKEIFSPIKKGEVKIYGCGPTVYWYQHIGNLYRYVWEDYLVRILKYNNYRVKHVINITDVGHLASDADEGEDKMVKAIKREGLELNKESMLKLARKYEELFKQDLKKLNIQEPDFWPRATENILEMISIIKKIEEKNYSYKTSVGLIFDTSKFKDYGKLVNLKKESLKFGSRVKADKERKNSTDFALWITNQPNHLMLWDSPWGKGFPGWHIECSAMSHKYFGDKFDIHTGGQEHIPVHHTNEIAQSEVAFKVHPWVNYWLHIQWLIINRGKMSKSLGNVYLLSDLEKKGFSPTHFRYFCLTGYYRKPLNFNLENLQIAKNSYERLKNICNGLKNDKKINKKYLLEFREAINDDLNMPRALHILWKLIRDERAKGKYLAIKKMDEVFGMDLLKKQEFKIPKGVQELVKKREQARKEKNFKISDEIREKIKQAGFEVQDTSNGAVLKKAKRI